ncbi:hypothetical protein AB0X79_07970 [Pediococcus pentosaceus]|uniref:hypothetical protein n=1 Tax=Pediococcus pentosaceus TaxID=1255 RepID=UPI003F286AF5
MLKEYRKTTTIKAEQFDGSDEMIDKYDIRIAPLSKKFEFRTPCRNYQLDVGDWIIIDGYYVLSDEIFKKTYEEVKNDQGYMQYINSPDDMYAKDAYIDATFCEIGETEQAKYIYRAYAAGGQYEGYEEYEIGFSFDKNKILTMIDEFIAQPSLYSPCVFEYISVQRFALDEFDPLDPDKGYKMDDLYEVDYSSDQHFVKTEQKYWDKFLNDEGK